MKYKVGDKVRVKRTLSAASSYGGVLVNTDMAKRGGEIATITKIYDDGYNISGDYWFWNDEMLEPAYADSRTIKEVIDDYRNQLLNLYRASIEKRADNIYFNEWTFKEEKKMPTKFTFYFNVNEGTRVDKSCNGTIPTITTSVVLDKFGDPDRRKCYSLEGEATCDKADYDMRQGVLEALANAVFDGNFEKAYDKAVKTNAFCERQDRTCHYCGKVFDTVEEKQAEEAWHVERKKARRERYLLRKRAKEIAFEEQAQKMAKEMIDAEKGAK